MNNVVIPLPLDLALASDTYETGIAWPPPNCSGCGKFVGQTNFGRWVDEGTYEMSEWVIYCKGCKT